MRLDQLPSEIKHSVAAYLSEPNLNALSRTNRHFCELLRSGLFQRNAENAAGIALLWAARNNIVKTAKLILAAGADVNRVITTSELDNLQNCLPRYNSPSWRMLCEAGSPLHIASQHGHIEAMQLLLHQGANTEQRNWVLKTCLFECDLSNIQAVKLLCDSGAKVDAQWGSTSILDFAVVCGSEQTMEFLLEQLGLPVNEEA